MNRIVATRGTDGRFYSVGSVREQVLEGLAARTRGRGLTIYGHEGQTLESLAAEVEEVQAEIRQMDS